MKLSQPAKRPLRRRRSTKAAPPPSELLWGDGGPYSEIHLTVETRILDDTVSRQFVNIDVHVNPYTFEFIRDHRDEFRDDADIQGLLEHAEYRDEHFGYVTCAFHEHYGNDDVMLAARLREKTLRAMLIKMHVAVMRHLGMKGRYN